MGKEKLSFLRKLYAAGAADEESGVKGLLQLFDGLADGRLTDKQLVGCLGDISG